jgi:hypothetical protein
MTTATTTTISGVSLITRQGARAPEVFEIVLSAGGIDFRRAERPGARLTWDRVSAWEIEELEGDVVLTLQGAGAATPLLISGWSAADLAARLRQLTDQPAEVTDPAQVQEADAPAADARGVAQLGVVELPGTAHGAGDKPEMADEPEESGETRDRAAVPIWHRLPRPPLSWKAVVTIALLGVLAAAVTIVLLQSAGIISWSFLGPTG